MKKVFLDKLPRRNNGNSNKIDWSASKGHTVDFVYEDIEGCFCILEELNKDYMLISYNGLNHKISKNSLRTGKVYSIFGEYKYEIGRHIKDKKRDFIITDREKREKIINGNIGRVPWYKFTCNKCGWTEGWIQGTRIKQGRGCQCCASKVVVEGINDIPTNAPWMVKYFQGGYDEAKQYTKSSPAKIIFKCPDCGTIKDKAIKIDTLYREQRIGCHCGDGITYPEKFIYNLLKQLNVEFTTQKRFEWLKNKKYDFYIDKYNIILEVHGKQHYERGFVGIGGNTLEEEQENDRLKKSAACLNKCIYIEIDARESSLKWIKESIEKTKMSKIFDLSNIDWNKCNEYALSNLMKMVCEIKNKDNTMTSSKIAEIVGVSKGTVVRYLKMGNKYGLCVYNPNKEMKDRYKRESKPIEMFDNGVSLGVFESSEYLCRVSEEKFGVKLISNGIRSVCKGKANHYKGYTFKYID